MPNQTVAHILAAGLARHGVSILFGQSIPIGLLHVTPQYGVRQIGYRAENAGGIMADGYARISGHLGVVCAQNGPAATLLVPPLAEAFKASSPVLAIVEEIPRADVDRNAFQEFDHLSLYRSCTKWARRLDRPERAADFLDMAVTAATSGRPGPAALMIPRDLFGEAAADNVQRIASLGAYPLDRPAADAALIAEAARLIAKAERPIIVAGGGTHLSGAAPQVAALSDLAAIPVATTNMGKGVMDERSPLALGVFGNTMGAGSAASHLRRYASEADLVILVGNRTNENGTDSWRLFPRAADFIHIDIDPQEVGRNYEALRLVGDARATLDALLVTLRQAGTTAPAGRLEQVAQHTAAARLAQAERRNTVGPGVDGAIRPEHLMSVLDRVAGPDDILVADASYSTNWLATYVAAKKTGARFLFPRGLAGLGWGLPLAMGAKAARPDRSVIAIVGDGGFGHCWSELESARRMGVNVVVIVLNNAVLAYQSHGENAFYGRHSHAVELGAVDHAAIAVACGCQGERVENPADFEAALRRALDAGKPALLDVLVDPNAHPPLTMFDGRDVQGEGSVEAGLGVPVRL
jgi:acetolactate synthase-1/2/3 large subunit